MRGRLERRAHVASAAPGVPEEARESLREEIRAHLEDSAAAWRAAGCGRAQAEKLALRDFGDSRKARDDIGRAWRDKRMVLFPDQPGQRFAHFRTYDLKAVLIIVAIVVLLRWQVVAAYHIPTKSMEPTLHGDPANGDKILVSKLHYDLYDPVRWQLAVFEKESDDRNLIKRIVGLPGETLDIRNGDIYIDGEIVRKPRAVQEDLLIPVFAEGRDRFPHDGEARRGLSAWETTGSWKEIAGRFVADAPAGEKAVLGWSRPVPDSYPGGSPGFRRTRVGDLVLEFRVIPGAGAASIGAVLREGENVFELYLPVDGGDAVLTNLNDEIARRDGLSLARGEPARIRFVNLDGRVAVEVDDEEVISVLVPDAESEDSLEAPAAEFGVMGGAAAFSGVRLFRDIYYHSEGRLPAKVPEDSYFMLGDNSGNSADSREWGPVPRDHLIGRPVLVFWPLSRAKILH